MILFKMLKTNFHYYIYDVGSGMVLKISKTDYENLEEYEKGIYNDATIDTIKKYEKDGFLLEHIVEKAENSMTPFLCHMLNHNLRHLTLQVTQNCNLRCEYCVYSGNYQNRVHTNKNMELHTAKKAINYLIKHSDEQDEIAISFYGGEPLLMFDLIQECVCYAKSLVEDRKIHFNMTTNATLLSPKINKFLYENDFILLISLDGTKEQHDRHRKFVNGKGTFDCIINNIRNLIKEYPSYNKNISTNTVMDYDSDFNAIDTFFQRDNILKGIKSRKTFVSTTMIKEELPNAKGLPYMTGSYEYLKALIDLIHHRNIASFIYKKNIMNLVELHERVHQYSLLPNIYSHGGPCLPGVKKLFVTVDGKLYPCERISELFDIMQLGSLDTGIDLSKAIRVLNIDKIDSAKCIKCWAIRECSFCGQTIEDENGFNKELQNRECINNKRKLLNQLYEVCILDELGFDFKEHDVTPYIKMPRS